MSHFADDETLAHIAALEAEVLRLRNALEAEVLRLRNALETFIAEHEECEDGDGWMAQMCSMEALHAADEVMSTPFTPQALTALKAENEVLRKDAERWRLLRKTMEESVGGGVLVNDEKLVYEDPEAGEAVSIYWYPDTPVGFYESKADTLDEAIDAMAKGEQR